MSEATVVQEPVEMIVSPNMGSMIANAEINQQIATAKRFPRSIDQAIKNLKSLSCMTVEIATSCNYTLPQGDTSVSGASIRFAEILISTWGNCRVGGRIIDEGKDYITAQGVFMDLEHNVAITREVQRRIVDKRGQRYKIDTIIKTGNAAVAIAVRNAVLSGIPKPLWEEAYGETRKVAKGDEKTFEIRRTAAVAFAKSKYGISKERLFRRMGVNGESDITMDSLLALKTLMVAIDNEETTADVAFPEYKPAVTETLAENLKRKAEKVAPKPAPSAEPSDEEKERIIAEEKKANERK